MLPDDHVCVCNRVSLRKLANFMQRERPTVASQLSECLGAGTACHWCVPFLRRIHEQWQRGEPPNVDVTTEDYAARRQAYHKSGVRDDAAERGT